MSNRADIDRRFACSVISTVPAGPPCAAVADTRPMKAFCRQLAAPRSPASSSTRTIFPFASTVRRTRIGLPTSEPARQADRSDASAARIAAIREVAGLTVEDWPAVTVQV